jgi:thiol-disulfide isomerase/thioredoxin
MRRGEVIQATVILALMCAGRPGFAAALSEQCYHMKGELTVTVSTHVQKYPVEIVRDQSALEIKEVTQPEAANYCEIGYLSTSNMAVTFSRFAPDGAAPSGSWNNGQIDISHYRMPTYPQLALPWLMTQAREEFERNPAQPRFSLMPYGFRFELHERPQVVPLTEASPRWGAGFSRYSQIITNSRNGSLLATTFAVDSWTNCDGVVFPRSCSCVDGPVGLRYDFVAIQIDKLTAPIDTRLPSLSEVTDWRPFEDGQLATGCSYEIRNGFVFRDILQAAKAGKVKYDPALDWVQSHPERLGLAPDFAAKTAEGAPFKLSDLRGKFVLLDFWSTSCAPCLSQMPSLKEVFDTFGKDSHFAMVGLALDDNASKVKRVARKQGMRWPQVLLAGDFDNPVVKQYKVIYTPTVLLLGPDGKFLGDPSEPFKASVAGFLHAALPEGTPKSELNAGGNR